MDITEINKSLEINQKVLNGLKILMSGQTLMMGEWHIGLCEAENGGMAFYQQAKGSNLVFGQDMPFHVVYKWLNDISDERITVGLANIVLREYNRRDK